MFRKPNTHTLAPDDYAFNVKINEVGTKAHDNQLKLGYTSEAVRQTEALWTWSSILSRTSPNSKFNNHVNWIEEVEISETDLVEELKHVEDIGEEEDNIDTLET